ncbi:hypothetical protein S40293_06317 [Stachybotrys chartarum IBT 40293]|nr:hypothetical protein S40293_06317 [Stachybotrys chartarum IBT 40293]
MATDEIVLLEALFHHLVLPPKLPQSFDGDNTALARSLGGRLRDALATFRDVGDSRVWRTLEASLQATVNLNQGPLYRDDLLKAFQLVKDSDDGVWLGLHVVPQNAALIVHRDHVTESVILEEFETAAPVSDVLKAEHALTWDFPSRAVTVPLGDFGNESFLENLSRFLEQASSQAFDRFAARGSKGGQSVVETRDCPSPALISEMLMSLLEGLGSAVHVRRLRKRVRDDVVLDASEIPWRRSPYWLVLRVTLGRILSALLEDAHEAMGRAYYKFIMCAVLANLLRDCVGKLHPEMTLMLQAKLCRRLAKLEAEKMSATGLLHAAYADFFAASSGYFGPIVADARNRVVGSWEEYKKGIIRKIPLLPLRAPKNDLLLDLPNSHSELLRLLSQNFNSPSRQVSVDLSTLREGTVFQVNQLATRYSSLVDYEANMTDDAAVLSLPSPERRCTELAEGIERFLDKVGDAYVNNSLLMSRYLLRLFELWMRMDEEATAACPLLKSFHPLFVPSSLDVLCLQTMQEMQRLGQVQRYIDARIGSHNTDHETIFGDPRKPNSFPLRYVYSTQQGEPMTVLAEEIDAASQSSRARKQSELADLTRRYDELTQAMQSRTCTCTRLPNGSMDVRGCTKCWQKRSRYRLKINAHEDFLPLPTEGPQKAQRAAILLELRMPRYLAAYRAAVWKLYVLGSQLPPVDQGAPQLLLKDVKPLKEFLATQNPITLASRKKSFLQTHYGKLRLPKKLAQVVFPFGAEFAYYDTSSCLWADQLPKVPWFQHLLGNWLPRGVPDPYACAEHVSPDKAYHPSSYEIMANESACPPELSVHEFSAFQRAVSGRARRWLVLLVELGTTNINFSSEATMELFNRLALQAGPAVRERGVLREAHSLFSDQAFCTRLYELLRGRIGALTSSWREAHYMSILVTLSLRLYNLCPQQFRPKAETLFLSIRSITCNWISNLRNQIRSTSDGEVARKASTFAFWAALLCRQTFWAYKHVGYTLSDEDAQNFFRASIALQENLLVNLDELNPMLKRLLVEDLSTSYIMRDLIKEWFGAHQSSLECSINETWADSGGLGRRSYSPWKMLSGSLAWWATSRIAGTKWTASQVVHYHLLQGHLIVDGKPLGRLPLQMRQDPAIQELFGGQHLLTRPSSILEYQLVSDVEQHQVHFGSRDGQVVIRVFFRKSLLEYVPRDVFKSAAGWDLPSGLVDDCVHWLNLQTGQLEMRRKPWIWKPKPSNWILDVRERVAVRNQTGHSRHGKQSLGANLVEPRSEIGQRIASIFRDFEDVDKLTIYQPAGKGSLSVEMKRLEIRFSVNSKGLLECRQLGAEVDPQQDAGTLYGLSSQVILRNVVNPERRRLLVPYGKIYWKRRGMHVVVKIVNEGIYVSFSIDQLLGRLDCPPEPLLLYLKAAIHALTSFPLPDGLTLRTGTEEARHCLLAARSQPWNPLKSLPQRMLSVLKSLSPKRWYYPPGMDLYQKVEWDNNLTMSIQHEELALLVDSIRLQSQKLEVFGEGAATDCQVDFQVAALDRLCRRGRIRRQLYERVCFPSDVEAVGNPPQTFLYDPAEHSPAKKEGCRVYQTTRAMRADLDGIPKLTSLSPLLEKWASIGGFEDALLTVDIEALLDVEISQSWGSFVQACQRSGQLQAYDAHFLLALLAFGTKTNMNVVQWLVAIYKSTVLRDVRAPRHSSFFNFRAFEKPSRESIRSLILAKQPLYGEFFRTGWKKRVRNQVKVTADRYEKGQMDEATHVASRVVEAWPHPPPSADGFGRLVEDLTLEYIHVNKAWETLGPELQRLLHNFHLSTYLRRLEEAASRLYQQQSVGQNEGQKEIWKLKPVRLTTPALAHSQGAYSVPRLGDLMLLKHDTRSDSSLELRTGHERNARGAAVRHGIRHDSDISKALSTLPRNLSVLDGIIKRFSSSSKTIVRKQYGKDLQMSLMALIQDRITVSKSKQPTRAGNTAHEVALSRQTLHNHEDKIRASLSEGITGFDWLSAGGLWPCLSPVALLEQLRDVGSAQIGPGTKAELVQYGVLITKLQRLLRMRDAELCRDERRLREDQEQEAHSNWRPLDHPEWLLLEIDNNLLIRPSQIDVARAIISPASSSNSVLQMNMGQGKTSCIMPMAVAVLADNTRLCRLVVPRPLLLQTAQVIQSRIGGLVGRAVRHIPFSRRSPMRMDIINLFQSIHEDTRSSGGVMLCLPEHIMSFKLSGLQQLADGELKRARRMIDIQRWLETSCRDVLDESDFTLSAKTQLVYPSGVPMTVDGHPQRWQVVEELLLLVEDHVPYLQSRFSGGIEIMRRHQGYPILHFLRAEVDESLNALLVNDVCEGRLPQVQFKNAADVNAQRAVGLIVSGVDVDSSTWQRAAESLTDDVFGLKNLYLLRGLISRRLLLACLKKRWNVQYGLHPQRAPIAVPFEAKGVPSPTAEYGHPDTALVLTCLAFYQTGLTKSQMTQCLQYVLRSDDPPTQYERLVHGRKLPARLEHWNLLNTDDEAQVEELWTYLRLDTNVLNYFLNKFAFPAHAKQFGVKLQASGWDIPLLSKDALSRNLTTGFSGTNDNKRMLPQTIKQDDLPSLVQTNAEVLSYLLEPRNQRCYQAVDRTGRQLTEKGLLELLRNHEIRIFIDAGAHILEMENHDLAAAWLDIFPDAQGAVYFDHDSRIMVRARFQKAPVPLLASPFAENLEQCVVYIDEAHTRGTDLKLPVHAKGAVTLGLGQTKDQTVQAAMRLRQLGSTQSVAFIMPPEVHRNILDLRPSDGQAHSPVVSADVVYWLLEQSCKANENMISLHAAQGFDFCRRTNALWKYSNSLDHPKDRLQLLDAIQQPEDRTLEQLYGPRQSSSTAGSIAQLEFECLQAFAANLSQQELDPLGGYSSAFEEVEQEREVEFEFEQLREKQKPVKYTALVFPGLNPAITHFATTGQLREDGGFIQGFDFLGRTKIGRKFGVGKTTSRLFVSREFTRSIAGNLYMTGYDVVRCVEWVLWSAETQTALIIIPEEAELLIPMLRGAGKTGVSLLTYAAPVTKSMWLFNTLTYFTMPTREKTPTFPQWLSIEIGILAGRLYFDYSEYASLLAWLGIDREAKSSRDLPNGPSPETVPVARGLFVDQPLKFLLEWLTYRRQTLDIMHTPMGYVCQRRNLDSEHSFFNSATASRDVDEAPPGTQGGIMARSTEGPTGGSDDDSEWGEVGEELAQPSSG